MTVAYYARPVTDFKTNLDKSRVKTLEDLGYDVIEITDHDTQEAYKRHGMEWFGKLINEFADVLFFSAFTNNAIGAGVAKEIAYAKAKGIPVFEFPTEIDQRVLSVSDTRAMLRELK